ncbi:MAG: ribonuclease HII [Candidatus Metalachnospira sp.]|nr:ribonuclease HII [Candidatus Metalachnospira sp.]
MSLKTDEVKKVLSETPLDELLNKLELFKDDERTGIKKLVSQYEKKYSAYIDELKRLNMISAFENDLKEKGYKLIGGIDEVGRGPLAGPVMTAVVILPDNCRILGINDSKKLSAKKREELSELIKEEAIAYSFGSVSPSEIDEINILQATYKAMRKAINSLAVKADFILADAVTIPEINIPQRGIIHGDAKSITIGAASIIAKVERDAMMDEYDNIFPEYGFAKNKGYGSAEHIEAVKKYGPCLIHRSSFIKNFV